MMVQTTIYSDCTCGHFYLQDARIGSGLLLFWLMDLRAAEATTAGFWPQKAGGVPSRPPAVASVSKAFRKEELLKSQQCEFLP